MGDLEHIFVAILVVISMISVVFCIVRGRGASHKKLVFFVSMIGVVAVIGFGGEAALNLFDMGWRCTPVNIMLTLGGVFFIATLWYGMRELIVLEDANPIMAGFGFTSMLLAIFITLTSALSYFTLSSWWDGLTTYNDQTIVFATDQHGGSAAWRYYNHINSLVHGSEILKDGWHGSIPRPYH